MKALMMMILIVGCAEQPADEFLTQEIAKETETKATDKLDPKADKAETKAQKGDKGDRGDKGEKGDKGERGEKGDKGEAGAEGAAGLGGPKGDKGDAGSAGSAGARGDTGAKGDRGDAGAVGPQGLQGSQGSQGIQGVAGEAAHRLTLVDMNDQEIGQVYHIDGSSNDFWAVKNSMRFEIDQTDGTFPNAYLLYSGANCSGEERITILNGKFANVYVDARDNSPIKASGLNLGSFSYQSRVPAGSSCQNAVGSALVSYATEDPVLGFSYPVGRVYIRN